MLVGRPIYAIQTEEQIIAFCEEALSLIPVEGRTVAPVALPGYVTVWRAAAAEANMDAPTPTYWATGLRAEEQLFQVEWVLFAGHYPVWWQLCTGADSYPADFWLQTRICRSCSCHYSLFSL